MRAFAIIVAVAATATFAQHALLRTMRAVTTWFCDAHASWQKGGVENANGRLRRWLPRQIDDCWRATVMVRPRGCLICAHSLPYITST